MVTLIAPALALAAAPAPGRRARGRPRRDDVAAIEGELLGAAFDEFVNHGYGGASMARIVRKAGISKTTLWSRYAGKEALFRAIMQRQIDRLGGGETLRGQSDTGDIATALREFADHMLASSLSGELLQVNRLIQAEAHRFPELGAAAAERTGLGITQVAQFLARSCAAQGRPCHDPRGVAEAYIHALRGWYFARVIRDAPVVVAERQEFVVRLVDLLIQGRAGW